MFVLRQVTSVLLDLEMYLTSSIKSRQVFRVLKNQKFCFKTTNKVASRLSNIFQMLAPKLRASGNFVDSPLTTFWRLLKKIQILKNLLTIEAHQDLPISHLKPYKACSQYPVIFKIENLLQKRGKVVSGFTASIWQIFDATLTTFLQQISDS